MEVPKQLSTITDIKSFLGLCNVYRRLVPNFACITAPGNAKLGKGEPVVSLILNVNQREAV